MGSKKKLDKEFTKLLDKAGLTGKLEAGEALEVADTIVTTLTLRLLRDVGSGKIPLWALNGPAGGGGPHHRLDLLLRYSVLAARAVSDEQEPGD